MIKKALNRCDDQHELKINNSLINISYNFHNTILVQ